LLPARLPAIPMRCHLARSRRILALSVAQAFASVNDARGQVQQWADRRVARRYARPLEQPGGGREPCSPGQRGPLVHRGCSANTASGVRRGSEPGPFRAPRLSRPSRAGAARAAGFRAPLAQTGQASGEGALAPRRRRGAARRGRLCGPACDSGWPAVGTSAKTTRRGLVTTGSLPPPTGTMHPERAHGLCRVRHESRPCRRGTFGYSAAIRSAGKPDPRWSPAIPVELRLM
jgi:hypothetical protein